MRAKPKPKRIYRYPDLKPAGVPFTRKHVNTLEGRGEFPERVWLGPNSCGWVADEVDAWVEEKIRRRNFEQRRQQREPSRGSARSEEHRAAR